MCVRATTCGMRATVHVRTCHNFSGGSSPSPALLVEGDPERSLIVVTDGDDTCRGEALESAIFGVTINPQLCQQAGVGHY
jgi:hypothetical protein